MKNEPCNLCSCHESTSSHDKWNAITFGIVEANEQNAIIAIKFVVRFPGDHAWNAIRTFVKSRIENALEKRTHPIHVRTHIELSILLLIIIIIAHVQQSTMYWLVRIRIAETMTHARKNRITSRQCKIDGVSMRLTQSNWIHIYRLQFACLSLLFLSLAPSSIGMWVGKK